MLMYCLLCSHVHTHTHTHTHIVFCAHMCTHTHTHTHVHKIIVLLNKLMIKQKREIEKEFISMMLLQHLKGRATTTMVTIVVVILVGKG